MASRTRICISAAGANAGGAVTYLLNFLSELRQLESDDRYLVIAPRESLDLLSDSLAAPSFDVECYPYPPVRQLRRLSFDQLRVSTLARRYGAQVLLSANGFGTYHSPCPEVLLVRNALYFSRLLEQKMQLVGHSTRSVQLRRLWSRISIRGADSLVFPTRAMRDRVADYVPLARKSTEIIHYGFDRNRFLAGEAAHPDTLAPIAGWQQSGRKALLYVAGYAIHKNFETAIESLHRLLEDGKDVGLVLTAVHADWGDMAEFDALLERIRQLGIENHILMTGALPWSELHSLYAACDLFLFPSFLESFGHPMIEAMASGLPSVAAETQVNREIFADCALFFRPFDPQDCANAVRKVLEDDEVRQNMQREGLRRVDEFSWPEHVRLMLKALKRLAHPPA